MTRIDELIEAIRPLRRSDLDLWIAESLVVPEIGSGPPRFSERECARVRLICTLRYELEVEPETLPLVLSLMDQLYETRGRLRLLTEAVTAQEPQVREAVLAVLRRSGETPG